MKKKIILVFIIITLLLVICYYGIKHINNIKTVNLSEIKKGEDIWYEKNIRTIKKVLGFKFGSPYFYINGISREIGCVFEDLEDNGILVKAGIKKNDILILESKYPKSFYMGVGFYKWLYQNQGKKVSIKVAKGGDGKPIKERKQREITFTVPYFDE